MDSVLGFYLSIYGFARIMTRESGNRIAFDGNDEDLPALITRPSNGAARTVPRDTLKELP
jgi:hypothetical protein